MTAVLLAALTTRAAWSLAQRGRPGGRTRWEGTNHAGAPVTLLEGPAFVVGATAAGLATGLAGRGRLSAAAGPCVATAAAGLLGALDDLGGDDSAKGLGGHLRALAQGRVTTGSVKIVGLALTGLVTAHLIGRLAPTAMTGAVAGRRPGPAVGGVLVSGALVAGCANLANLFDLRPGRALKVVLLVCGPLAISGGAPAPGARTGSARAHRDEAAAAAIATGSALALLAPDLVGRAMLGDTGANGAGALVGSALLERLGPRGRGVALAAVVALTIVSERVSFTRVIDATPVLRELDALGRAGRG